MERENRLPAQEDAKTETISSPAEVMADGGGRARLPGATGQGVTWRALALALALALVQSWWIAQIELIHYSFTRPTLLSLPLQTLFLMLLLVAANTLLRRRPRVRVLTQGELLTIYLMLSISGAIGGYGFLQQLISLIVAPVGWARPENQWDQLFWRYLPNGMVLEDAEALGRIFAGGTSFWTPGTVRAWAPLLLSWGGFVLALFAAVMSLSVLLRRRWIEEERLTFPLAQVPLAVTDPKGTLYRSRAMWIGFGVAFLLGLVNCLSAVFPSVPSLEPNLAVANQALAQHWSCLGRYGAGQHGGVFWAPRPWAVGVAMLMPLEVAFSQWFFFVVLKVAQVLTLVWGWEVAPDAPFPYQQSAGALIAIGGYALWSTRRHLWRVVREALRPEVSSREGREPLTYRWALVLLVVSVSFLCVFVAHAGAPPWLVPLYLGIYLTASLALSRIRAEVGGPANVIHSIAPSEMLTQLVTPGAFPVRALVALTLLGWTSPNHGADPTPFQMEGLKLAERSGMRARGLVGAMLLAAVAGLVFGSGALLGPLYRLGIDSAYLQFPTKGRAAFSLLETWLTGVAPGTGARGLAMGGGLVFTLFLYGMQARFVGWPLNPVGYVLAPMWFTHHLWLSIFIAWLAKALLLRYGGIRGYLAALPFFLGLVLGDCAIGGLWFAASSLFALPNYGVWL